jgi:hypothetical protein
MEDKILNTKRKLRIVIGQFLDKYLYDLTEEVRLAVLESRRKEERKQNELTVPDRREDDWEAILCVECGEEATNSVIPDLCTECYLKECM